LTFKLYPLTLYQADKVSGGWSATQFGLNRWVAYTMKKLLTFLILFAFMSCSSNEDDIIESLEEFDIELNDGFEIVSYDTPFDFAVFIKLFDIRISDSDKQHILTLITSHKTYPNKEERYNESGVDVLVTSYRIKNREVLSITKTNSEHKQQYQIWVDKDSSVLHYYYEIE
jgi:hypothetical protein